jgi:hypothetical protein
LSRLTRTLAVLAALTLVSCGSSDEDEFAGTYSGDAVDSQSSSNRKDLTLTLAAAGATVSGTYRLKAILIDTSGIVNGTMNGSALALVLTPSTGSNDCPYTITGTWSPGRITGTYAAVPCFVRSDGTFELKKK